MTVHELDLASIQFARDCEGGRPQPCALRAAEAACSCGLRYHVSATSLPRTAMLLGALVLRHLHEMQQIGEPIRRWPIVAG